MIRVCGDCTLCCKAMAVPALDKPAGAWCPSCHVGNGCGQYAVRPEACAAFQCGWLQGLSPEVCRPDKTHVVLFWAEGGEFLLAIVDAYRPDAWKAGAIGAWLQSVQAAGLQVILEHKGQRRPMPTLEAT